MLPAAWQSKMVKCSRANLDLNLHLYLGRWLWPPVPKEGSADGTGKLLQVNLHEIKILMQAGGENMARWRLHQ